MISLDACVIICFSDSFFNLLSRFLYLFCISSSNLSLVSFSVTCHYYPKSLLVPNLCHTEFYSVVAFSSIET